MVNIDGRLFRAVVKFWFSSPVKWLQFRCNLLVLYDSKDDINTPHDFILLDGLCSVEEKRKSNVFEFSVYCNGYIGKKAFHIEMEDEYEFDLVVNKVKELIRANAAPNDKEEEEMESGTAETIRICSYNVNYGCCKRRSKGNKCTAIYTAIMNTEADIVLLQETTIHWENFLKRKQIEENFPFCEFQHFEVPEGLQRPPAGGLAILSKYPIQESSVIQSPSSWFPAQRNKIQTHLGVIQILNVHLRPPISETASLSASAYYSSKSERIQEVQWFAGQMEFDSTMPSIVCGDFNEDLSSGSCSFWTKNRKMTSALAKFNCGITWKWPLPFGFRITGRYDHFFYQRLCCTKAFVLTEGESDHFPVCIDVTGSNSA
mmetsp:Transcript_15901/g.20248  ORF Transcript_15901/g.20248 Transcript_15901/m.20248 type:complete len:373 (-) Transcript_15901:105-1223(-)